MNLQSTTNSINYSVASLENKIIKTTCPYCGVGCGINIENTGSTISVTGDKTHPANYGKLCIKGKNLNQTLSNDNRLITPEINGHRASWPRTLDYIASKFASTIEQYGKESVAFYVSGQLLTEDYYVANKLMKGFIGSGNIDTNSRLCMSSAVAAHKRAFGEDIVPLSYSDIINSDLIILAGSNLAWCHPVIYQRIREEKQRRPALKVVVIDPRKTASVELADLHLPIKAGKDLVLFNALLHFLTKQGARRSNQHHLDEALSQADISEIDHIGLTKAQLAQFFQWFNDVDKVVTVFSQGINQSKAGSDQGNAIINCHLVSGKIGRAGCGPFSITGQPNAMGGREVGALANTLASHIEFDDSDMHQSLSKFWDTDNLATSPGLKAVDLFDAMASGKIKAVWIMATNPVVSMPDHDKTVRALKQCDFVVVSDCVASNDTITYANVVLPAKGWGEKDGSVTNSERRISRQRPFLKAFGQAKADWWIISEVAKRMGYGAAFNYQHAADIFKEHAALSGLNNKGRRGFDISAFANLTLEQYNAWIPKQWPQPKGRPICLSDQRFFEDNHYYTPSSQGNIVPCSPQIYSNDIQWKGKSSSLILNTGRNRDQWHTQTRSGKAPQLTNRDPEPVVDMHPSDGAKRGITDQSIIRLKNNKSEMTVRCHLTDNVRNNELFMPIHWSQTHSNQTNVSALIDTIVDPISGQPAFKQTEVCIEALDFTSEALLLVKSPIRERIAPYQIIQQIAGGYCYHLASMDNPQQFFERLFTLIAPASSTYLKRTKENYCQGGYLNETQMLAGCFVAPKKKLLPGGWAGHFFDAAMFDEIKKDIMFEHAGTVKEKSTFCQCLKVNLGELKKAITDGAITLAQIREKTGAGNGCGSCIDDIILHLPLKVQS